MTKEQANNVNLGDTLAHAGQYGIVDGIVMHGTAAPYFKLRGFTGAISHLRCEIPNEMIYDGYNKAGAIVQHYLDSDGAERAREAGMIARWSSRMVTPEVYAQIKAALGVG